MLSSNSQKTALLLLHRAGTVSHKAGVGAAGYHSIITGQWGMTCKRKFAELTELSKILERAPSSNDINFSPSGEGHAACTGRICFTVGTHVRDSCCLLGHVDFAFSYVFLGM